jgi:hypothetical protein
MGRISKGMPKSEYLKIRLKPDLRERLDLVRERSMPDIQLQDFAAHILRLGLEAMVRSSADLERAVQGAVQSQLLEPQRPAAGDSGPRRAPLPAP